MDHARQLRVSKRISRHLRHAPAEIGLELGPGGWVSVADLLAGLAAHGLRISRTELEAVVAGSDKQRFAFDQAGELVRANQGHSVPIDLVLPVAAPPDVLFHGTVASALDAIRRTGLLPMKRHHVHLSTSVETATKVGARRGRPVVLRVDAAGMVAAGRRFMVSENKVWLVDAVPPEYLTVTSRR